MATKAKFRIRKETILGGTDYCIQYFENGQWHTDRQSLEYGWDYGSCITAINAYIKQHNENEKKHIYYDEKGEKL